MRSAVPLPRVTPCFLVSGVTSSMVPPETM